VREGVFREDLFHRLNVIRLRLPALRERREDIPMLTRHFLQLSAQQLGVEPKRISDAAMERLTQFHFPGNVRQLENICHWLTVMAPAQVIEPKDLPPEVTARAQAKQDTAPSQGHSEMGARAEGEAAELGGVVMPSFRGDDRDTLSSAPLVSTSSLEGVAPVVLNLPGADWEIGLEAEAMALLAAGRTDVWDVLSRRFEGKLIATALANTRGRRIEAAHKLGIGRNTITRKIQELGLE
jgi:two-component system nitrogen regulation response regulator GlnG